MKNYKEFIKEAQQVYLGTERYGFETNKYSTYSDNKIKSISGLNNEIKKYIESVYGPYGFSYGINEDINVNGLILKSEYINKMVNNYTIFKRFIIDNQITDEETFYSLIISNFDDIYHYNGDFFKRNSLPILINTTRKGNINEKRSIDKFEQIVRDKGFNITVKAPTIEEDIRGIDGKFSYIDKDYTLQIKPFSSFVVEGDVFKAKSDGSLSLGVDYLILYREDDYIILKNQKSNPIRISYNYFVYNQSNIVYSDV